MTGRERATFTFDPGTMTRIRQCGARNRGGASGYLEALVRRDAMQDAVADLAAWYQRHPNYAEDSAAEFEAAAAESDESEQGTDTT
jgi:hypothetical protein